MWDIFDRQIVWKGANVVLDPSSGYTNVEPTTAALPINGTEPQVKSYESENNLPLNDAEYQEALRRSHNEYYGTHTNGEPSYSSSLADTATSSWTTSIDPNAYELSQ